MQLNLDHEIVLVIFLQEENKWAFYHIGSSFTLPVSTDFNHTITYAALFLAKNLINVDVKQLKIENLGFVDSIEVEDDIHNISFGYLVQILPGMHVDKELEFLSYAQIRDAAGRISENHLKLLEKSLRCLPNFPVLANPENG